MISKLRDQKQLFWSKMNKLDRLRSTTGQGIDWSRTSSYPNDVWAGRIILGFDWWLWTFATYWINGLKMIVKNAASKITILMGLTIMQASKNFKNNWRLRIFERSISISKTLVKHMNNWGETNPWCVWGLICRCIQVAKNCKAVGSKDSRSIEEQFGASCKNKINGIECNNGRCIQLSTRI